MRLYPDSPFDFIKVENFLDEDETNHLPIFHNKNEPSTKYWLECDFYW